MKIMTNGKISKNTIYKDYFDAIYSESNNFSKKEYEVSAYNYDLDFGNFLPSKKDVKILDIGCGTGHFLNFLMRKGYINFIGIDISQSQIEFCKKFITQYCKTADAFDYLNNKKNFYSIISANDVIEHIPPKKLIIFLRMIYSALKPEAVLFLKLPNMSNPFALNNRYRDFTHECGFTEKSIYQVLYAVGFRKIIIKPPKTHLKSIKDIISKAILEILYFFLRKMFWYQGFAAPKILSSRLVVIAKK